MNATVCKEHEWVSFKGIVIQTMCKKCGKEKPLIDFKISDNLSSINKLEWEDIWNEFRKTELYTFPTSAYKYAYFFNWLKEKYFAPEKKNI